MAMPEYKRGWYRKGKSFRYFLGYSGIFFICYQTLSEVKKHSHNIHGVNMMNDKWFSHAAYVGDVDIEKLQTEVAHE
jgi:hypothetical protein